MSGSRINFFWKNGKICDRIAVSYRKRDDLMKVSPDHDRLLLEQMEADLDSGTAAVFEAYGGLVWSACARRLEDPEDIRECVNDTFLDFSTAYRKFDPEKGSLGNYLCTIALRRATDRYRRLNTIRRVEEQYRDNLEPVPEPEYDREALDAALERLDPVDARILREKYYHGMTYQQIAASIGMPYDTVKKRGQRNLKRLRAILIGMILALLAAGCAYLILRSYQFAEGVGPNFDPDRPIYQLSAVDEGPCVLDACTYFVENVAYQDGQLYVKIGVLYNRPWPAGLEQQSEEYMLAGMEFRQLLGIFTAVHLTDADGNPIIPAGYSDFHSSWHDGAGKGTLELLVPWEPALSGESLTLGVRLSREQGAPESLRQEFLDTGLLTAADVEKLEQAMPSWSITLEKLDFADEEHTLGTFLSYLDTGFLVRGGTAYSGGTHVALYPYQLESAYILSDMLLHNYSGAYDDRAITLTAPDGTVYPADQIRGASVWSLHARDIYFPGAAAGEYVMTIPYLCVSREDTARTVTVAVPTQVGQTLELDETVRFRDGSGVRLTGIRLDRRTVTTLIPAEDGSLIEQGSLEWDYILECEPLSEGELVLLGVQGNGILAEEGTERVFDLGGDVIGPDSPELVLTVSESNYGHREYREGTACTLALTFRDPTYILDQPLEIPVTVSPYEGGA